MKEIVIRSLKGENKNIANLESIFKKNLLDNLHQTNILLLWSKMVKAFLGREGIQVYSSEGPYPLQGETKIKFSISVKIVLLNIV